MNDNMRAQASGFLHRQGSLLQRIADGIDSGLFDVVDTEVFLVGAATINDGINMIAFAVGKDLLEEDSDDL
jgi:stage V sporulation protein SpoVS